MCDECHTVVEGNLRIHIQNVHQRSVSIKVTFDGKHIQYHCQNMQLTNMAIYKGQTLAYKLERQADNEFHCPCGSFSRASARNIGTHCKSCRAGFAVKVASQALDTDQASLGDQKDALNTELGANNQEQAQDENVEQADEDEEDDEFVVDNQIGQFCKKTKG